MVDKKLHLLFDANPLVHAKSGVGQFSERLLVSLAGLGDSVKITAYYFNFLGLKKDFDLPANPNIQYKVIRFLPTKLFSILHRFKYQLPLEFFLNTQPYDFVIFPNFVAIPSLRKLPYCVAIHDMAFKDCPEYLATGNRIYLDRFVGKSAQSAAFVITISNFTKQRIEHWYGPAVADHSLVLSLPYEPKSVSGTVSTAVKNAATKPFLLFVGTLEPRKNLVNLVRGFALLPNEVRAKYHLVLAGGKGWGDDGISQAVALAESSDVVLTGYINDVDRDYLYKKASAVCMLSHYEGFGMPILEAFYYQKPVLLSSIAVFKEIGKDQAVYCDPDSPEYIAEGMMKVIASQKPPSLQPPAKWQDNAALVFANITESLKS